MRANVNPLMLSQTMRLWPVAMKTRGRTNRPNCSRSFTQDVGVRPSQFGAALATVPCSTIPSHDQARALLRNDAAPLGV